MNAFAFKAGQHFGQKARVAAAAPVTVLGRAAVIRVSGRQYVGTVLDTVAGEPQRAKRIRIQSPGAEQGRVVQPSEYIFLEWDT